MAQVSVDTVLAAVAEILGGPDRRRPEPLPLVGATAHP
jgi:hypothetical protein